MIPPNFKIEAVTFFFLKNYVDRLDISLKWSDI